jgi:hypothetical protein
MKDEHSASFRIAFALALVLALLAYAYFLYPTLRARVTESYREHVALEKDKDAIAEIMLDPALISERITDMEGQLLETRPIKDLTPAGVVDDITRGTDRFGLELQGVVLGIPEAPGGAVADSTQLLSMPVTIHMKAPYDGGMYFIGSLEKSTVGTYKIGSFSFEPVAPDDAVDGDTADADAVDGGIPDGDIPDGAGDDEAVYPIFEWYITVYLLYYG